MKKLILLELAFLFLATTFSSNPPPPGWYQQTLLVADQINDIFFLDSLNGWVVTPNGYIMNTENGGDNWSIQKDSAGNLFTVQFLDSQTGYVVGNGLHGIIYKTTNGGLNWNLIHDFNPAGTFRDMSFVNKDTGWVCSDDPFDGGVFKTTNGGQSWVQQVNLTTANPQKIFFVNNDTGWIANNNRRLYKSTNGGIDWNLQFTSAYGIDAIFFLNGQKGWMRGGPNGTAIGISYTTNGGSTWISSDGNTVGGFDVKFVNDSIGYSGTYESFKVMKSTNGGKNWGFQSSPIGSGNLIAALNNDTSNAWAGRIMHTKDGGGKLIITGINENNNLTQKGFQLSQNYPNPFNPVTNLEFRILKLELVSLKVYDLLGKEVATLADSKFYPGIYKYKFDGRNLNSGVYFYRLEVNNEKNNEVFSETKKMLLVK